MEGVPTVLTCNLFCRQLLQNELNSDIARFTNHVRTCLKTKKVSGFFFGDGKTKNIAIQLVLPQFCKLNKLLVLFLFLFCFLLPI